MSEGTSAPTNKTVFELGASNMYGDVTDKHIEELSNLVTVSDRVTGTAGDIYLRTMIQRIQVVDGGTGSSVSALAALDSVESRMYEAVKRGALTVDIQYNPMVDSAEIRSSKAKEHNRRCNWARSIKSELKGALKAGVPLSEINAFTTSKKSLREAKTVAIEASIGMPSRAKSTDPVVMAAFKFAELCKCIDTATASGRATELIPLLLQMQKMCVSAGVGV